MKLLLILLGMAGIYSCSQTEDNINIREIVKDYYQTYQERKNFEKFLDFYDEKIILEDIILGEQKIGKREFAKFFNWNDPSFSKIDSSALIIQNQIFEKNHVCTQGYFTPFEWGKTRFEAMHFTSLLTFGENGKIVKQVDWINYPKELVDYENRPNSNKWIEQKNQ